MTKTPRAMIILPNGQVPLNTAPYTVLAGFEPKRVYDNVLIASCGKRIMCMLMKATDGATYLVARRHSD